MNAKTMAVVNDAGHLTLALSAKTCLRLQALIHSIPTLCLRVIATF